MLSVSNVYQYYIHCVTYVWTLRIMLYIVLFCSVYYKIYEFIRVYIEPMTYWSPYWSSLWQTNELGIHRVAFPFTSNNTNKHPFMSIYTSSKIILFWKSPFYWCPWWACLQISCKLTCKISKGSSSWNTIIFNLGFGGVLGH